MTWIKKQWVLFYVILTGLLGVLAIGSACLDIGKPFGGFLSIRVPSGDEWTVSPYTPSWWPGKAQVGLTESDKLVSIDGEAYGPNYPDLYNAIYQRGDRTVSITILRNGVLVTKQIPIVLFTTEQLLDVKLPVLISSVGFWLLALLIYRAKSDEPLNRYFAVVISLIASIQWIWFPGLFFDSNQWINRLLDLAWVIQAPFIGITVIHASMLFTTVPVVLSKSAVYRNGMRCVACGAVVSLLLYLAAKTLWWGMGFSNYAGILDLSAFILCFAMSFGGGAFAVMRLSWVTWRKRNSPRFVRQGIIILGGLVIATPALLNVILSAVSYNGIYFFNNLDLRYLYLAVPLAFALVILRYQTFHGIHPLFLLVCLLAATGLLSSGGDWLIRQTIAQLLPMISSSLSTQSMPSVFVPLFSVTFSAGTLGTLLQQFLNRLFYWERSSYHAVKQFATHVADKTDIETIPREIASALVSDLGLEHASVWLWDRDYRISGLNTYSSQPKQLLRVSSEVLVASTSPYDNIDSIVVTGDQLSKLGKLIHTKSRELPVWLTPLREIGVEVVSSLYINGQSLGLLAIGKRWDEEVFRDRDLEILELITQYASLLILSAEQIRELRLVPMRISKVQNMERTKIGYQMHDTIQSFLGRLQFALGMWQSQVQKKPEAVIENFPYWINETAINAGIVRQIRDNLAPQGLGKSLIAPLTVLVEEFAKRTEIQVTTNITRDVDTCTNATMRGAIYGVVRQAMENVEKHASAKHIALCIGISHEKITLEIKDDGCGFNSSRRVVAEEEGHFGLVSMQDQLSTIGGDIDIISESGQGTRICGWLPIMPATQQKLR